MKAFQNFRRLRTEYGQMARKQCNGFKRQQRAVEYPLSAMLPSPLNVRFTQPD